MALSKQTTENDLDLQLIYEEGVKIYNQNETFQQLSNVMEDEQFRDFFDKFSQSEMDWKTIGMFMQVYQYIERNCTSQGKPLNKYQKIYILDQWMKDSSIRPMIIKEYLQLKEKK